MHIIFLLFYHSVLVEHMDEFAGQAEVVSRHIPSRRSKEMATKSEVVSGLHKYTTVPEYC